MEGGIEIGLGLHNEPVSASSVLRWIMNKYLYPGCTQGVFVVSPRPSFSDLVSRMMDLILNQDDDERAFVPFDKSRDELVLFVNNMGGMSVLELYAVVDEVHIYLGACDPFHSLLLVPPSHVISK